VIHNEKSYQTGPRKNKESDIYIGITKAYSQGGVGTQNALTKPPPHS